MQSTKQRGGGGWRRACECVSLPARACGMHKCGSMCLRAHVCVACVHARGQEGIVRRVVSGQSLREEGWPAGGRWTGICTKNFLDGEKPGGPVVFRELGGLHGQESKGEPLPAPAKGSGKA